jgi:5'-methylthioadenosine phosphorylase
MVTDYDCWHPDHDAVTVAEIIGNLTKNAEHAAQVVAAAVRNLPLDLKSKAHSALKHALLTDPKAVPAETRQKLDLIVGKYLS